MISGKNLRKLLELRQRLRVDVLDLSVMRRRALLREIEILRRARVPGPHGPMRDLAPGEVLREIKWLLNTFSLEEAEAAVRVLERLKRAPRSARPRR